MNHSIMTELETHVADLIADGVINADNIEDAHFHAFNEDYYIIGHWNAEEWLKRHKVSAWEAIEYVAEKDRECFGEVTLTEGDYNPERIVNLLAYHAGAEIDIESVFKHYTEIMEGVA